MIPKPARKIGLAFPFYRFKLVFIGQWPSTIRYKLHLINNILWAPRPVACYALRIRFGKLQFTTQAISIVILSGVKRSRRIFAPI